MGVFFDEPGYPVIDKAPRFWKTGDLCGTWATAVVAVKRTYSDLDGRSAVGNFSWKDWATFAGTGAVCYPFGWAVGQRACHKGMTADRQWHGA